ncbi:MAG: TetR/AcrR family transcriptional regulator [Proteobacteria bacterium]|nr:TetR/AcrR family transcriptional regulator [Pseudomonadota bacterium]
MTTDSKKPTSPFNRTTQHDAKRAAILSQAARLFNSKGSRATTLKDIAESLGLTKTSLYYYVKTKEELIYQCYMATLQRHHGNLDRIEKDYSDPVERMAAFFSLHFEDWQEAQSGEGSHFAALLEIASLQGSHRTDVEAQYISMFKRLRQILRDGIDIGALRSFDATSATRAILGSVEWSFSWLHKVPKNELSEIVNQAMDILGHGFNAGDADYKPLPLTSGSSAKHQLEGFNRREQNRLKQEAFYKTGTWFFNKKGFNGTSLDEIAEQLNVSKGAFYYHIKNKEDLLFNCYTYSQDIMASIYADTTDSAATGLQNIDQTCRRIFIAQNSDQGPLIRYNTITSLPMERRKKILARTDKSNQRFGDLIRKGIEDGSVRPINIFVAENLISGAINAAMDIQLWRNVNDIESAAIDYFDIFINGLLPRK